MIYKEGKNYHFLLATPDSIARIQSKVSPFYDFPKSKIPDLPSLSSDPLVVPKFLYEMNWNRIGHPSSPIESAMYISYDGTKIHSEKKPEEKIHYITRTGEKKAAIEKLPFPAPSKTPFYLSLGENETIQVGGIKNKERVLLTKTKRTKYGQNKYLSLRDIVNPNFSEEEIKNKIEELYFNRENKTFLFRLVQILYSGTPAEENKIVSNLFSFEPEFAKFLSKSIFTVEIIPLIHGPFIQNFISNFDERYIKHSLPSLSPQVRKVLEKSVSKNKFKMILDAPSIEPKQGESFLERLELEVYKTFARNVYFEEGHINTYKETDDKEEEMQKEEIRLDAEDSSQFNFWTSHPSLEFFLPTKTKLFFLTRDWIQTLRFDWFLSRKMIETYEFHRLPPGLILEVPYFPTGLCLVGGGITNERKEFECCMQWFAY